MKYLFFDTETTGLPEKGSNWETDYETFPYVVQIAWQLYEDNKLLSEKELIIKPDGWIIPNEVIEIHGIDNKKANKEGKPETDVFDEFLDVAHIADKIIGHNIYFDTSIIKACLMRLGGNKDVFCDDLHKDKREDTCRLAMTKFKGQPGNRMMSLGDLYNKLFDEEFENAHTALADVGATARIYFELEEL